MLLNDILFLIFALVPFASGDVKFVVPGPGGVVPGGTNFKVSWTNSDTAPPLGDLVGYSLMLYSGSNSAPIPLLTLVPSGTFATASNSASINIPVTSGELIANAYFLGIQSTTKYGGFIINYSDRFTVDSMAGKFPDVIKAALSTVSGTAGPQTDRSNLPARFTLVPNQAAAPAVDGQWAIPYNQQMGDTKYAPMQPVPPKAITATNLKPLWPTSGVTIATTFLPKPSVVTTITQPETHTIAMHANTAAAQSQPADDMQKYLNRWKD